MSQQNRSQATEEYYAYRARLLRHQAARAFGITRGSDLLPTDLARYVIDKKTELATRSWRVYKAAITASIEAQRNLAATHNELCVVDDADKALQMLARESSDGTKRRSKKTSAGKRKGFPKELRDALFAYLEVNRRRLHYAAMLKYWLHYSLLLGLRPCEWEGASLDIYEGKPALRVDNAKHSNGRGNGACRTLLLHHLPDEERAGLEEWLRILDAWQRDEGLSHQDVQNRLRQSLHRSIRRVAKDIGMQGNLPTLYSSRHQWSANMKKLARERGWSMQQVAALHGHAADDTASTHYGKSRSADEEFFVIEPVLDEAARVRPRFKGRELSRAKGGLQPAK